MRLWVDGWPVQIVGAMPYNGQLYSWGRADDRWWGLIRWDLDVVLTEPREATLRCAAWVPASRLRQPVWSKPVEQVPRLVLPGDDASAWPEPPDWDGWWAGTWESGDAPIPPNVVPAKPRILRPPT